MTTPASPLPPVRHALPDEALRGACLADRISLAVSWALRACSLSRSEVARRISADLGQVVSVNMLDGYASQARQDHRITLERFMALIAATGQHDLLGLVCAPSGAAAVPDRYVDLIELQLIEARLLALAEARRAALDPGKLAS